MPNFSFKVNRMLNPSKGWYLVPSINSKTSTKEQLPKLPTYYQIFPCQRERTSKTKDRKTQDTPNKEYAKCATHKYSPPPIAPKIVLNTEQITQ